MGEVGEPEPGDTWVERWLRARDGEDADGGTRGEREKVGAGTGVRTGEE